MSLQSEISLPDLHSLETERLKVFWILADDAARNPDGLLSSYIIAQRLERDHREHIPRHRVDAILRKEKTTVLRKPKAGVEYWKIMRPGLNELSTPNGDVTFVDPKNAFTSRRLVKEILADVAGQIRYCDPYVDSSVLDALAKCAKAKSIKLLTSNISGNEFVGDLAAFNREFSNKLQVRKVSGGKLHDRYVLHDAGMLLFGASLKDVGKAPSFVVSLDVMSGVREHFDAAWGAANQVS